MLVVGFVLWLDDGVRRFVHLAAIVMALMITSLPNRADDSVLLSDSIQPVAESAHREALTPDEAQASLSFAVALKMRNLTEFQARVARGERITAEERVDRYEPRADDYQAVLDWLVGSGFTITRRDSHHLSIFTRGEIGRIAAVFQMQFAKITLDGKTFTGAITPPRVPAKIAPLLIGINGLQPWHVRH